MAAVINSLKPNWLHKGECSMKSIYIVPIEKKMSSELEQALQEPSITRVADSLHYLVVHAEVKQYYYELKYLRDEAKLLKLLGDGLKQLDTLKKDEKYKAEIEELYLPNKDDILKVLSYYNSFKEKFTIALAAMSVAWSPKCPKCSEKGSERREG